VAERGAGRPRAADEDPQVPLLRTVGLDPGGGELRGGDLRRGGGVRAVRDAASGGERRAGDRADAGAQPADHPPAAPAGPGGRADGRGRPEPARGATRGGRVRLAGARVQRDGRPDQLQDQEPRPAGRRAHGGAARVARDVPQPGGEHGRRHRDHGRQGADHLRQPRAGTAAGVHARADDRQGDLAVLHGRGGSCACCAPRAASSTWR